MTKHIIAAAFHAVLLIMRVLITDVIPAPETLLIAAGVLGIIYFIYDLISDIAYTAKNGKHSAAWITFLITFVIHIAFLEFFGTSMFEFIYFMELAVISGVIILADMTRVLVFRFVPHLTAFDE